MPEPRHPRRAGAARLMAAQRAGFAGLFFSARGRLGRGPFLVTGGALAILLSVYESLAPPGLHWVTGWLVYPAFTFIGACLLSKRLHDRGRSGWWAALVLAAVFAVWPRPEGFWDFLAAVVLVWAVVELGAMPSEPGANRFGPRPGQLLQA
jgi:uncharacterized membrane protein YhaH (DUF805 family)